MKTFEFEVIESAIGSDESIGFCVTCGSENDCCEPDARKYKCENCGVHTVYGAEEILIMGLIK